MVVSWLGDEFRTIDCPCKDDIVIISNTRRTKLHEPILYLMIGNFIRIDIQYCIAINRRYNLNYNYYLYTVQTITSIVLYSDTTDVQSLLCDISILLVHVL